MSTEKLPKALQMLRDMGVDIKQFTLEDVKGLDREQLKDVYNSMLYTWKHNDPSKNADYHKSTQEEKAAAMRDYIMDAATGNRLGKNSTKVTTGKTKST